MSTENIIAIHQPNFFPWLGYFHKIAHSDTFILLDNVQSIKTGGSYLNRVQMAVGGNAKWVTIPIVKSYHGTKLINEIEISYQEPWKDKFLRTIQTNYGRAKHFDEVFLLLKNLLALDIKFISEWNIQGILAIKEALKLHNSKVIRASSIVVKGTATERLIELTKACNGTVYLSGNGASGYQEPELYQEAGIELRFQSFTPLPYDQNRLPFIPGLSIIDALMHLGWAGTRELII